MVHQNNTSFSINNYFRIFSSLLTHLNRIDYLRTNTYNMKFTSFTLVAIASLGVVAHPERLTAEIAKREANLVGRTSNKCAAVIEKRREAMLAKRASRLHARRVESGHVSARSEHKYTTIQNDTCVLAPDTIFGPYG